MKLMMKKAFYIYKSFHFATEPCNLCEAIWYAPLCPLSLSLSSFSASFTFVSWHSSRLTKARAAEHTKPTTTMTTTARYIRRNTTICIPTVLSTPGINYATSKNVYQDNVIPLSAERKWKRTLLNRPRRLCVQKLMYTCKN